MDTVAAALIGVLGIAAGALLQHWLSRRTMANTTQLEQITKAYADYLSGVAGVAQSQRHNDPLGLRDSLEKLTDAKTRIVVHGDRGVIAAMAAFDRHGAELVTQEGKQLFVSIVQAMRRSSYPKEIIVPEQDILRVVFGSRE